MHGVCVPSRSISAVANSSDGAMLLCAIKSAVTNSSEGAMLLSTK